MSSVPSSLTVSPIKIFFNCAKGWADETSLRKLAEYPHHSIYLGEQKIMELDTFQTMMILSDRERMWLRVLRNSVTIMLLPLCIVLWFKKQTNMETAWESSQIYRCKILTKYLKWLRDYVMHRSSSMSILNLVYFPGNQTFPLLLLLF